MITRKSPNRTPAGEAIETWRKEVPGRSAARRGTIPAFDVSPVLD
jgi:hypothetical protein